MQTQKYQAFVACIKVKMNAKVHKNDIIGFFQNTQPSQNYVINQNLHENYIPTITFRYLIVKDQLQIIILYIYNFDQGYRQIEIIYFHQQMTSILKNINLINIPFLNTLPSKFKDMYTPQQRWQKHLAIVKDNPQIVSVIIEKAPSSKLNMKRSFLQQFGLKKHTTLYELRENIKKVLQINQKQALTLFCAGILPMVSQKVQNLQKYKQPDGFIYFYISEHESFGANNFNNILDKSYKDVYDHAALKAHQSNQY